MYVETMHLIKVNRRRISTSNVGLHGKFGHPTTQQISWMLTPKGLREPKQPFLILGRLPYVPKVVGVFETS
jgi:hypothetical protein